VTRYSAFGFTLESVIELPDLSIQTDSNTPSWEIRSEPGVVPSDVAVLIGTDTVYEGVEARAYTTPSGLRLIFDDTGTFDIRAAERVIAWYAGARVTDMAVRADLLGRVMALAAHADGYFSLHASAVSIEGKGIAFLGPKHAGKSTLALATVRNGARFLTDDTLMVRIDDRGAAWAAPGVHRARLWRDSIRALDAQVSDESSAKPTVEGLTSIELETRVVPLSACYVVQAAEGGPRAAPIAREPMDAVHAAIACVRFSKTGLLLGGREGAVVLDRAARLTSSIPVFTATVRRDLASLDDVAAALIAWHQPSDGAQPMAAR